MTARHSESWFVFVPLQPPWCRPVPAARMEQARARGCLPVVASPSCGIAQARPHVRGEVRHARRHQETLRHPACIIRTFDALDPTCLHRGASSTPCSTRPVPVTILPPAALEERAMPVPRAEIHALSTRISCRHAQAAFVHHGWTALRTRCGQRGWEFMDLAPYPAGCDDVREIDWAATARAGFAIIKRGTRPRRTCRSCSSSTRAVKAGALRPAR